MSGRSQGISWQGAINPFHTYLSRTQAYQANASHHHGQPGENSIEGTSCVAIADVLSKHKVNLSEVCASETFPIHYVITLYNVQDFHTAGGRGIDYPDLESW